MGQGVLTAGGKMAGIPRVTSYIADLNKELGGGDTTEHTHRPALKKFIESLHLDIIATNEPKRKIDVGAPDMTVRTGQVPLGYIECKDIRTNLTDAEKTEQLQRYFDHLPNLILTDYLEFRWYVDGHCRITARLGTVDSRGRVRFETGGSQQVIDLLRRFLEHPAPTIASPKELAQRMARLAKMCRDLITETFEHEPEAGSLHDQLEGFRHVLLPDLSVEDFADMYAQTIAYGLFAARCNHDAAPAEFKRQAAWESIPKTNPFLRKMFNYIAGPDLDDRIAWIADELALLLARADMESVLRDFGRRKRQQDPVLHFYETFLGEFDPGKRKARGIYYTPEPVVSYIVRSIDKLLQTRFGKPNGLADKSVMVLDPACGTGTFLYHVIDCIREKFVGQEGAWSSYVAQHLLNRIFGFELMMAPYAVAHMKLGLQLRQSGYDFKSDQRLGIYMTNTLEQAAKKSEQLFAGFISEEADAAAEVKRDKPIMVVLGNPPWKGHSANRSQQEVNVGEGKPYVAGWTGGPDGRAKPVERIARKDMKRMQPNFIGRLLRDYYFCDGEPLGERNPKWLQDDYVKFLRFGQWRIERTGHGILAFITNHSYLDNPTFRGMRQSLMRTFDDIYVLDLHGSAKKRETCPDGSKDENVFDIQQGTAICIMVKLPVSGAEK